MIRGELDGVTRPKTNVFVNFLCDENSDSPSLISQFLIFSFCCQHDILYLSDVSLFS